MLHGIGTHVRPTKTYFHLISPYLHNAFSKIKYSPKYTIHFLVNFLKKSSSTSIIKPAID